MGAPRVAVIGAGPSGITAAKNLLQVGLRDVVVFEKGREVGGNWVFSTEPGHSSVYDTTHIISSKSLSEYLDYPWPEGAPDYPGHRELREYFQGYARRFGVESHVRFGTEVVRAEPTSRGFKLHLSSGSREDFDHLVVANGHHWDPRMPSYPGTFAGRLLHSHHFKTAAPFAGQRVLVIGGGNSACDIAVETARVSRTTAISMRRGYYFVPKFLCGLPSDVLHEKLLFLPRRVRTLVLRLALRLLLGDFSRYGLEAPDHEFLTSHPVVNSELLYAIRHGRVHPRRDVARFEGNRVHFVDGSLEEFDTVIAATGFKISFPFFDPGFIDFSAGDVPLFLRAFDPRFPNLFFVGLIQPIGCVWPLADLQSKLVANLIVGRYRLPPDAGERAREDSASIALNFMRTPRHTIEVDYHSFRRELVKAIPRDAPTWDDRVRAS